MKFLLVISLILSATCLNLSQASSCDFFIDDYFGYTCALTDVLTTERNQILDLDTSGHLGGRTNADVRSVTIGNGTVLEFYPPNLLTIFPNTYYLLLDGSGLTEITSVDNCESVAIIHMTFSSIRTLGTGAFSSCTRLRILDLSNNEIEEIHEDAFANLSTLFELVLYRNQITRIQAGLFRDLTILQDLYLGQNLISEIEDGAFENLTEMIILYMHDNLIDELRAEAFGSETALVSFNLERNLLTRVPRLPNIAPQIKYINLDRNRIAEINVGDFTFAYSNITDIELNENFLTRLDSAPFEVVERLDILSVSHNQIEAVDNEIFDRIPTLYSFYFERNGCANARFDNVRIRLPEVNRVLDHCYYEFVEPQNDVECNFINTSNGYTCELQTLQFRSFRDKFRLVGEHLDTFTDAEVRAVAVRGGQLIRVPPTIFRTFVNLRSLSVNNVGLSQVGPETFIECGSITHLDVSRNRIRNLPSSAFANCEFVVDLNLDDNQIAEIEPCNNFLTNVYLLETISLRRNLCVDRFIENYRGGYFLYHTRELFDPYVRQCYGFWYLLSMGPGPNPPPPPMRK